MDISKELGLADLEGEVWKDIGGFEGYYQVSNLGRIKSLSRIVNGLNQTLSLKEEIIKKQVYDKNKYMVVSFSIKRKKSTHKIHRLVAIHFIPNPDNKPQVNHIDGIKSLNSVDNLEWVTASENSFHAYKKGLKIGLKGEKNPNSKINKNQAIKIKESNLKVKELSIQYGLSEEMIRSIRNGDNWN